MSEFSEGISKNPESTGKLLIPDKMEEERVKPIVEVPISTPEQPETEDSELQEGQREGELVAEVNESSAFVSDKGPSIVKRVSNVFLDTRLRALAVTATKTGAAVIGTDIIFSSLGHPQLATYMAVPILAYVGYEAGKAVFNGGIQLGQFTNLFKEYSIHKVTPLGTIRSGEMVGSLHLIKSIGKMSDMSARERALVVLLDGLKGLDKLREKFEQDSKDVRGIAAIKASSHLVAQNRKLFEGLGFTIQDQSASEKNSISNKIAGKVIILPIWGVRQLFRERSLRGFREGINIRLGETQTAWITPQTLCSLETKRSIEQNIQRIEPILQRLQSSG